MADIAGQAYNGRVNEARRFVAEGRNRVLAGLPADLEQSLASGMEKVSLGIKHVLYAPGKPIEHVYFPLTCVLSLVVEMNDKVVIEVATVGNEGMLGAPVVLGVDHSARQAFAQVPGVALRMPARELRRAMAEHGELRERLLRYVQVLNNQIGQSTACNQAHSIDERMCRWLLMCHDRVGGDEIPLTQEFLAQMLGVRRPSVTVVAGMLQKAGLIRYSRGRITVLDRAGLEAGSCECYEAVRRDYEQVMG
jgi:CRP-like cAMP-binding protein